ncbi:cytochrome c/FTR1 family iron permease [Ramlibacter monticola]|uniref:Cytochrome c/FTR1 family iron permease n=1 Tax=Ramlibacter monticola TaxID=1926872 RepID=A0A936Z4N9_9BURK|nr:cytochrome c/FTR1 family iron permease [Ramlibacter monticola]MBL0394011.1 cytochrome c/FTR1 family iron permease [Ramlibacter monticola]
MQENHRTSSSPAFWLRLLAALLFACAWHPLAFAQGAGDKAQTVIHMLDYVSVDYPEAVKDGKVADAGEYQEQREFVARSLALIGELPAHAEQPALLARTRELLARVDAKAPGEQVAAQARTVMADLVRIYKLTTAPRQAPDLRKAQALFQAQCTACHGATGRGDGPAAKGMDPAPSNFHDDARMQQRSVYGLYNTITLGVAGTPMRPFTELSESDRWALAFLAAGLRAPQDTLREGEALWRGGKGKEQLGTLRMLVTQSPGEVRQQGGAALDAVRAWLTAHPDALDAGRPAPLDFTRAKLRESLAAYERGDAAGARQLAISAYLEGFELIEASLDNLDAPLRTETEREMMALRSAIDSAPPAEAIAAQIAKIEALLERAAERLSGDAMSPGAAFASSLLILLREGLEAILVLAAIIAFVRKTGRHDALPYIHAGWIGAVLLGAVTWVVASYLWEISGANRELTEGISALLAAAMLLYVGFWLHKRSYAQAWQAFIREHVTAALGKQTLWAMAGISFLAVYRELFEIVLFYQTLWAQAGPEGHGPVLAGIAAAMALLAALAWVILKYSVRLPIGPFFTATSGLLVLMAVVFVGNGVAALQEAGVLQSTPAAFVSVPILGIHPNAQGLLAQAAVIVLIALAVLASRRAAASGGRASAH